MKEYTTLLIFGLLTFEQVICSEIYLPHIAIIGGGIGGASTSHFLTELFNGYLEIDLYEAKIIGGRLATVTIDNNEIEAGGSIIHSKNMYMQKFVKLLGLEHRPPNNQKCGIWNGDEFVFTENNWFVSLMKLLYRYGFQIFKLQRHVDDILEDFAKIYDLQDIGESFTNVTALLSAMNKEFPKLLKISMKDYLLHMGFSERLIDELAKATVVTNYGQDTNIHSFVGLVSLAGAGGNLWSIKGGNKEVPEHLIYRNKNVNVISSPVKTIRYISNSNDSRQYEVIYVTEDNSITTNYDIVIIAVPLTHDQEFPIKFMDFPKNFEFAGNYHTTHATFVKADFNNKYFGLEKTLNCILSCNPNETKINSIGEVFSVNGSSEKSSQIWKIFSTESIEAIVNNMFSNITEKKEIIWKAYPHYSTNVHLTDFKLHNALYHVNAIEWVASAMEMSAIAGRNVAILAYNDFFKK